MTLHRIPLGLALLIAIVRVSTVLAEQPEFHRWAATPPMGWNSWDCYGPTVTESEVKANADFMAKHLKTHGWEYVVVDIRWYVRDPTSHGYNPRAEKVMDDHGRFWPAENRFPSALDDKGFAPLADYVHNLGLKFGIHLMRGIPVEAVRDDLLIRNTNMRASAIYSKEQQCPWLPDMFTVVAEQPGAQEYYDSVISLYASWGVDYLKIDDLSRPYHSSEIELIRRSIDKCGRPMVLSLSPGATPLGAAEHVQKHANLWRISDDFWDRWDNIVEQFDRCRDWAPYSDPGHWPDADMLPLGRIGIRAERGESRTTRLTPPEQKTLMTLWSIFHSPLMIGGDLPSSDAATIALLTNDQVLAVNQESLNNRELARRRGHILWVADVPDCEDKYVALFNLNDPPEGGGAGESVSVTWHELQVDGPCRVRDLWRGEDQGDHAQQFAEEIPFHGAGLYRVSPR
jgi:hypothetical protein